jgi:hypothetical protein
MARDWQEAEENAFLGRKNAGRLKPLAKNGK